MRSLLMAVAICALLALTVSAAIDGLLFSSSGHYKVDLEPYKVCIADFDKDGINDIACADYTTDSISILIGKGDADYEAPVFYVIGTYQYDIQAGDIDGDTWPDLVVATYNNVYTLLNDGDGTFGTATQIGSLANNPRHLRLAQLDGNADLELIVAHDVSLYPNLSVWDNDGSGNFTLANIYVVGDNQRGLAVADFDGTNGLDIAVITAVPDYSILLNDGTGGFAVTTTALGYLPRGICAADFDGGGDIEIAISQSGSPGTLTVYSNDGSGTFSYLSATSITGYGYSLVAADLDGQNGPDVAMADDTVEVFFNNGSGTLGSTNRYWVGEENECVAIGDLDNDGYNDLVTVGWPGNYDDVPAHVAVLINPDGNGQFMYPIQSPTGGASRNYIVSLTRAFFDVDANVDVATVDWWNDSVLVYLGDGAGHFAPGFRAALPVGSRPSEVVAMDVDVQNGEDLIIGHSATTVNYVSVLLSNGDGTFQAPVQYPTGTGFRPMGVYVDLLDNDGFHDIATVNWTSQTISVMYNSGTGTFGAATNYLTNSPVNHSAIDGGYINNDAFIDLVVPDGVSGGVELFTNTGAGSFNPGAPVPAGCYDPYQVRVADLDMDNYDDIIVGSYDTNEVCILMNNGGSGFHPTVYLYAGFEQYEIDVSDFDVDGYLDIVVLNTESYNFSVFFGEAGGGFSQPHHYGIISDDSEGMAIADFDNDGYPDIAISNYGHDNISVMLNRYSILTDVEDPWITQNIPARFGLSQNYPNPFNPITTIEYNLPSKAEVTISIYNLLGQRVTVFDQGLQPAGTHQVVWNGRTQSGQPVATGLYLYQIKAGDYTESKKMVLLK